MVVVTCPLLVKSSSHYSGGVSNVRSDLSS
jgi:hypothetical protein